MMRAMAAGRKLPDRFSEALDHAEPAGYGPLLRAKRLRFLLACHACLNETFGSMDLKRKFENALRRQASSSLRSMTPIFNQALQPTPGVRL